MLWPCTKCDLENFLTIRGYRAGVKIRLDQSPSFQSESSLVNLKAFRRHTTQRTGHLCSMPAIFCLALEMP